MKYKINDPINFIYFSQIASQCNKPLTVEVSNNIVSQEMALKHLFFPLFELPTNKNNFNSIINQAVSDFTPQPISTASAQHNSLHMKTNQNSNSSNAKCQNFDTSQLKDALSQIEGLKKALDVSTKEKEKLKSEIQKLKNELEASSGKVIQGTPSILIPQTTISDEKYEIQRLKSEILQKREELSLFRHGNPNAEIISKDKMIDLLQKRILELEKNKTIIDELKSKLEDFERKDQNGDVMNAKIEELSEMMLNFKATIKAKDDHINQLEKGIIDLKQKISNLSHTQRRMTVLKGSQNLEQALPPIPPSEKINSAADESQNSFPIPPPDDVPIKFSYNHFENNNNENKYQDLQRKSNSFIPIFWSKVPNIIAYNSFWKSINEIDVNINESEIESLFRYQDDLINSPKIPTPSKVFDKVSRTMNLIDPKHIKSTNILLSRLSKSVDEICYLIQNLSQQLTEDEILDLSSFSPTEDEKVAILSFEGDSSNLCNAEYFYYKILRIELLDEHLEFLRLRNNFPKILYDIELQTKLINNALISLITSPTFKHLLALILKIGNFVNVGTTRCQAYGFNADLLLILDEIKTNNPQFSLQNYVAQNFDIDSLENELFRPLSNCLSLDFKEIDKKKKSIEKSILMIQQSLRDAEKLIPNGYVLYSEWVKFYDKDKEKRVDEANKNFVIVEEKYLNVSKAFGKDNLPVCEFFRIFVDFIDLLTKRDKINIPKHVSKANNQINIPNISISNENESNRGVLDNLMKSLAAGPPGLRKMSFSKKSREALQDTSGK
ncbi:hypothetical protein TRFO_13632 [Tritrichomonas foetus]|uniref:FH2 domain-containing protein n=1 Tax=Tritrichomonas foetus TaxID=1144522 RepID=A0A1J4L232_9EUKA|nr:hypothetical protein TRFO_13632 [Tritrichomonas foetus]|eukprot:OHT15949.1 hypothetical protein TRFO_13632 [Tritrichomonas foetus]